jgi:hypothetical protein
MKLDKGRLGFSVLSWVHIFWASDKVLQHITVLCALCRACCIQCCNKSFLDQKISLTIPSPQRDQAGCSGSRPAATRLVYDSMSSKPP